VILTDYEQIPSPEGPSYGPANVIGLEIGGGTHPRRLRFLQFDAIDWSEVSGLRYELGDARALPYEDGEFDHVFSSNLLEHFPPEETTLVLSEWARVLRVGGLLELVVPDFMGILRDHFSGKDPWPHCEERIRGTRDYPGNEHRNAFTLCTFPEEVERIEGMRVIWCKPSHGGGGVYCLSIKEG